MNHHDDDDDDDDDEDDGDGDGDDDDGGELYDKRAADNHDDDSIVTQYQAHVKYTCIGAN